MNRNILYAVIGALVVICAVRGAYHWVKALRKTAWRPGSAAAAPSPVPATVAQAR